jgi:uncharacterized zinc-type alcohol dehydrogenase-like protein
MSVFPQVCGHEIVSTVAAKGDAVRHLSLGQRVAVGWYKDACGWCDACLVGDHSVSRRARLDY